MSPSNNYTVDSKEEIRVLDKAGNVTTSIRIWATSSGGTYYHVDVPEDELDKAPAILQARADKLDAI